MIFLISQFKIRYHVVNCTVKNSSEHTVSDFLWKLCSSHLKGPPNNGHQRDVSMEKIVIKQIIRLHELLISNIENLSRATEKEVIRKKATVDVNLFLHPFFDYYLLWKEKQISAI